MHWYCLLTMVTLRGSSTKGNLSALLNLTKFNQKCVKICCRIRWSVELWVDFKGVNGVCPKVMVELSWFVELPGVELTGAI